MKLTSQQPDIFHSPVVNEWRAQFGKPPLPTIMASDWARMFANPQGNAVREQIRERVKSLKQ